MKKNMKKAIITIYSLICFIVASAALTSGCENPEFKMKYSCLDLAVQLYKVVDVEVNCDYYSSCFDKLIMYSSDKDSCRISHVEKGNKKWITEVEAIQIIQRVVGGNAVSRAPSEVYSESKSEKFMLNTCAMIIIPMLALLFWLLNEYEKANTRENIDIVKE